MTAHARPVDEVRGAELPSAVRIGGQELEPARVWPRRRDHALLELRSPDGRTVAGQWFADPARLVEAAAATPAPAFVTAGLLVQPDGADARLRALPSVLAEPGARLVAHRPGRRAVVALPGQGGAPRAYAKVVRRGRAPDVARRGTLAGDLLGTRAVPRLLPESREATGVLVWSAVPGTTLHDLGPHLAPEDARDAWAAAGDVVARLHVADPAGVDARHGAEEELAAIADWLDPAVQHGLLDRELVGRAGDRVVAGLARTSTGAAGVLHRDLHDKQLLLAPSGTVGMIDVDTLAVGERALDVANLLVHLRLREEQGLLSAQGRAAAQDGLLAGLAGGGAESDPDDPRVAAYADAVRLRLAGVYAFRPRWRDLAQTWLARLAEGSR